MIIQHNIMALNAHRQLGNNNNIVQKNLEKLSSGYKINRAGDDAAGLAISEKMRAQITGLTRASANAQDGISLVQTAEGALTEVHSMLNRMVDLSVQSANGTMQDDDRTKIQDEMKALTDEIDRISQATNFNGINLLDGSLSGVSASTNGTTLNGGSISKFTAAKMAVTTNIKADLKLGAIVAGKDTFSIDGQSLTIDWTQGEAASVFAALNVDLSAATATTFKDLGDKLTNLFNNEMKAQGLSGSVKVTGNAAAGITFESTNKTAKSEFSFIGTSVAAVPEKSVGGKLFGSTKGESKLNVAGATYKNATLAAGDAFLMKINGKEVRVELTGAITTGDTAADVATQLTTDLQTAITDYNTLMGLAAGDEGFLVDTEFTVEAKDGGMVIKYAGNEKVNFSFNDYKDETTASNLGLAAGGSAGGAGQGLSLQIGDTGDAFNKVTVSVANMSSLGLGINNIDVGTQGVSDAALASIKEAITTVSTNRSAMGALQNRLEHTINNLGVTTENMTAAESRIRDVDMAKEMMHFTKNNVLSQAAQAMLAQANQQPQQVLQLLR